jgi:Tfp pilus assembly protein PilN
MSKEPLLVIDGGLKVLTVGSFVFEETGPRLQSCYTAPCVETSGEDQAQIAAWAQALKTIVVREKLSGSAVWILSSRYAFTTMLRFPHVEASRQAQMIAFEASQTLPYPLDQSIWDSFIVADDLTQTDALLAAAKSTFVNSLTQHVDGLGLQLDAVYPRSLIDAALYSTASQKRTQVVLLIHFGEEHIHFTFCEQHHIFVRCTAFYAQSEEFPRGLFERLVDETIDHYVSQTGCSKPKHYFVTGILSLSASGLNCLKERYGDAVRSWSPLEHVDLKPGHRMTDPDKLGNLYAGAFLAQSTELASVNLLPLAVLRERLFKKKRPWVACAAVCLSLTPLPYWFYFKKMKTHYETGAQVVAAELAQIEHLDRELQQLDIKKKTLSESIQTLESLNADRSHWVRFLTDLNARMAMVNDVWLDSLESAKDAQGNVLENQLELSGGLIVSRELLPLDGSFSRETASLRVYDLVNHLSDSEFITQVHEVAFDLSDRQIIKFKLALVMKD